jgi:hypothetical protein
MGDNEEFILTRQSSRSLTAPADFARCRGRFAPRQHATDEEDPQRVMCIVA